MKYLLILSILLLSSCTQYRYDVSYEKCNGQTFGTGYIGNAVLAPLYNPRDRRLYIREKVNNVCDFSYTRSEIK